MIKLLPLIVAFYLAASPMYCGKERVIRIGYTKETVRTFCGTPYEIDDFNGYEVWTYINPVSNYDYRYNFYLTFEDGRLVRIERY